MVAAAPSAAPRGAADGGGGQPRKYKVKARPRAPRPPPSASANAPVPSKQHWQQAREIVESDGRVGGVFWNKKRNKWEVKLKSKVYIGLFADKVEATAWSLLGKEELAAGRRPVPAPAPVPPAVGMSEKELRALARKLDDENADVKGVGWGKEKRKWRADIRYNGKTINLGYFDERAGAIQARLRAEAQKYGGAKPTSAAERRLGLAGGAAGAAAAAAAVERPAAAAGGSAASARPTKPRPPKPQPTPPKAPKGDGTDYLPSLPARKRKRPAPKAEKAPTAHKKRADEAAASQREHAARNMVADVLLAAAARSPGGSKVAGGTAGADGGARRGNGAASHAPESGAELLLALCGDHE